MTKQELIEIYTPNELADMYIQEKEKNYKERKYSLLFDIIRDMGVELELEEDENDPDIFEESIGICAKKIADKYIADTMIKMSGQVHKLQEQLEEERKRSEELESELSVKDNLLKTKNGLCADNNELPVDPIEVAQRLINATFEYEASSLDKALFKCGDTRTTERYSVDELEQIAEHLLVYCRHNMESDE